MINFVRSFLTGVKDMISGADCKLSLRRTLALIFSIDFVYNLHYVFRYWEVEKSYADASMLFGIEAGLIAALLSLTTYTNVAHIKKDEQDRSDNII